MGWRNTAADAYVVLLLMAFAQSAFAQCADIPTFADGLSPTSEIHVDPDGDDGSGDGSPGNPYATVQFAINQATPGTAVIIHEGTYAGGIFVGSLPGEPGAPIWIGGAAGEARPVIQGGGTAMQVSRATYVALHDVEFRGASLNGVNFDDGGDVSNPLAAHHILFRNLLIHDIGSTGNQDCLKLSGLRDYVVLDSVIADCGDGGSGIDHVGCHRGLIARCDLTGPYSSGVQCKGGSADIEIRNCRIADANQRAVNIGGSTGFEFFRPPLSTDAPNAEARNIRVLANIFEGSRSPINFVGCVDSVVANNTIVRPDNWIIRILQETTSSGEFEFLPCGDNRFENNIVYFDRGQISTYLNIGANVAGETFSFASNLWYAFDSPAASQPSLPVTESNAVTGEDPLFNDPAADYRIDAESPAAGMAMATVLAASDVDGNCYADPPSIGAFEVDQAAAVPTCSLSSMMAMALMMSLAVAMLRPQENQRC